MRRSLQSSKSAQRWFSRQHLTAGKVLAPAVLGSWEAAPGSVHASPPKARLQPTETPISGGKQERRTVFTQNNEMHPNRNILLRNWGS